MRLNLEYAIDPLEILFVREVMRTNIVALPVSLSAKDLSQYVHSNHNQLGQRLYPIVEETGCLLGVIVRSKLQQLIAETQEQSVSDRPLADFITAKPVVAYQDEPLRIVVYRMAETGLTRLPIVENSRSRKLVGMISLADLLKARVRNLESERRRERLLHAPFVGSRANVG